MKLQAKLFQSPDRARLDNQKTLRLALVWFIGFVLLLRLLVLFQFLADLDYDEVHRVRLVQFIFFRCLLMGFLASLAYFLWKAPNRAVLWFVIGLCLMSLYFYQDMISWLSTGAVLTMVILLYRNLYPLSLLQNAPKEDVSHPIE